MKIAQASKTAYRVALSRAAHQVIDNPKLIDDPIAVKIASAPMGRQGLQSRSTFAKRLRAFLMARSKLAEDEVAKAYCQGVRQYVVLGSGLDTFAYRNPYVDLQVFEVDHADTQAWKLARLKETGIASPATLRYISIDFEQQKLLERLVQGGFDPSAPAFFSWLGVSMYLDRDIVAALLTAVAPLTLKGGGIVFDYLTPFSHLGFVSRLRIFLLNRWLAYVGEPFRAHFSPYQMREMLTGAGYKHVKDMGTDEINLRYFNSRADNLTVSGPLRLVCANV